MLSITYPAAAGIPSSGYDKRRTTILTSKMLIESLNIGLPKNEIFHGRKVRTGISKIPVSGPIHLSELGFDGDGVADHKHHGGPDKAR